MCMRGVVVGFSLSVPSLASVLAILFPVMPKCPHTLCMWIVCWSSIFGLQFLLLVNCLGGDVVMLGVVCGY